jgi:phosphate transport system permease protein
MPKDRYYTYRPRIDYEMSLRRSLLGDNILTKDLPLLRRLISWFFAALVYGLAGLAVIPLFSILWEILSRGLPTLSFTALTSIPTPEGGGFGNAILGTLLLVGCASLVSIPLGISIGIYLAEFEQTSPFDQILNTTIRFVQRILSSVPSIVIGVFAYSVIVYTSKQFSAFAGSFALVSIMLPVVSLTTEESIRRVPNSLRLAAAALGGNKLQVIWQIVLKSALPGITTGCLLAISRAAGETAPLIFTAFGNPSWSSGLFSPTASLPVLIFKYSTSSEDVEKNLGWTAALVLLVIVLISNIASRFLINRRLPNK